MAKIPRMSRNARRQLIREGRRTGNVDTAARFLIVATLASGRGPVETARIAGVARSTVGRTADRFEKSGVWGLYDRRRSNGRPKVDSSVRRCIIELLQRSPEHWGWSRPTWTRELLCLQVAKARRVRIAVCTMGRILRAVGARRGSARPVVLCPWSRARRESRLRELRRLERAATIEEPVLYLDEVDIHLNPRIGKDWMLKGQQRRIVTPGKNKKFYIAGALDVLSGKLVSTGLDRKGSPLFCEALRLLAETYPTARAIHVILDNYSIHKSTAATRTLRALGDRIQLHFLPPYCPDANRIERVWQELHANVTRNHRCRGMAELLGRARRYLQNYRWARAAHHLMSQDSDR